MRKKRIGITLLELIMIVIVIGIFASFAYPTYENIIEDAKSKIDDTNLKALQAGLDIYAMENDSMPGDLSQLPFDYINRGYAQVIKEEGMWKIKLAYFISDFSEKGIAYATEGDAPHDVQDFLKNRIAKGDRKLLIDPSDSNGGISYGLNIALQGMSSADYHAQNADTFITIGDCDVATFSTETQLLKRHKKYRVLQGALPYAQYVRRNRKVRRLGDGWSEESPFNPTANY